MNDNKDIYKVKDTKRCPRCGRELPRTVDYFRMNKWGYIVGYCRDCERERHKEHMRKTYVRRLPRTYINRHGQIMRSPGKRGGPSIVWTEEMMNTLRADYPTALNNDLAKKLNISQSTLTHKAKMLGLRKDRKAWRAANTDELYKRRSVAYKKADISTKYRKADPRITRQWTISELYYLKAAYPVTNDTELAGMFGCSITTVIKKAKSLGLRKNRTSVRLRQVAAFKRTMREKNAIKNTVEI
jgi:hypothetical protein